MENNYIIYCHLNKTNGKRYIGQTKQSINKRWGKNGSEYLKKSNDHFINAIKKYGWDGFEHIILYTNLSKDEANEKEIEMIALFNSDNPNFGYNKTKGGNNNTLTKEQKDARSKLNKVMWENGTFKKSINTSVYCIELDMDFESALEAERKTGIDNSSIQKTCKGKSKYAGFTPSGQPLHWIYTSEKNNLDLINSLKNKKEILKGIAIPIYCPELNLLFSSTREVEEKYHINATNIRACIRGVAKSAGKHPESKKPLHWIECPEYINSKNKISIETFKQLKGEKDA